MPSEYASVVWHLVGMHLSTKASLEELQATRQKLVTLLLEVKNLNIDDRAHELKVVHEALKIVDELIAEQRGELAT